MHFDINPVPASVETVPVEAPAISGDMNQVAFQDGTAGGDQEQPRFLKDFRETMADLFQATDADAAAGAAPVIPESPPVSDTPVEEGLLVAPGVQPPTMVPEQAPLAPDTGAAPSPPPEISAAGGTLGRDSVVTAQKEDQPTVPPFKAIPKGAAVQTASGMTAANPAGKMAAKTPEPSTTAAVAEQVPRRFDPEGSRISVERATSEGARGDDAPVLKPTDNRAPAISQHAGPSTEKSDLGGKSAPPNGTHLRADQLQGGSGQTQSKGGEAPANIAKSIATQEGPPQAVSNIADQMAPKDAEAGPMRAAGDLPLEAAGNAGPKSATPATSALASAGKTDPAPPQPLPREEVVQQIVESAKVRVQNGQTEMRIQLKPEHLGQVRLNISTDQQQVMVKVVADMPMVKELLESNLHQLRSELSGQGLEIDKFEVSVGGDQESQNKEQQTWGQRRSGGRGKAFSQANREHREDQSRSEHQLPPQETETSDGVDYFA